MAKVTIEKSVDGKRETAFSFPACFLCIASSVLPQAALDALREKGLDVAQMLAASKRGTAYKVSVNVVEKGIRKTVVISLS